MEEITEEVFNAIQEQQKQIQQLQAEIAELKKGGTQ